MAQIKFNEESVQTLQHYNISFYSIEGVGMRNRSRASHLHQSSVCPYVLCKQIEMHFSDEILKVVVQRPYKNYVSNFCSYIPSSIRFNPLAIETCDANFFNRPHHER